MRHVDSAPTFEPKERRLAPGYTKSEAAGIVTLGRPSTSRTPEGSYLSPPGFRQTTTPSVVRSTIQNSGIPALAYSSSLAPRSVSRI